MPYINQISRQELGRRSPETVGELNFAVTGLLTRFLTDKGLNYTNYNNVIGVLECAKLELYRRMIAPYEDIRCQDNCDVYPQRLPLNE